MEMENYGAKLVEQNKTLKLLGNGFRELSDCCLANITLNMLDHALKAHENCTRRGYNLLLPSKRQHHLKW